ncbi:MAG: prepilin peptidase [Candidatus Latescibacteria bacterium]|nr:prepilin peptidase [Candidatus Latescibacterota bacterium]
MTPLMGVNLAIGGMVLFVGSAIGSFLNVCIHRIPLDQSIVWPSSYCPSCQAPIRASDNIPILSYLRLRGRCRACQASISIRYPIVEGLTGLAAVGCYLWLGLTVEAVSLFLLFLLLLPATVIDLDHRIIPNELTYAGLIVGVGLSVVRPGLAWTQSLAGALTGGMILLGIRQLGQVAFKQESMGLGDVKLMVMIGAFVGWKAAIISIFLACLLGTLFSIPILVREARGGQRGTHQIPFGPFLSGGGLLAAVLLKTPWFPWPG